MVINPCVFECGVLICIRINLDIQKTKDRIRMESLTIGHVGQSIKCTV